METQEHKQPSIVDFFIDLRNTIRFLWSRKSLILSMVVFGAIIGVLFAWLQKPKYVAVMTFFTEGESKGGLGMYAGLAAQFGLDLGSNSGGAFEGENLMEIFRSRNLIKKTLLSPVDETSGQLMIEKYIIDNGISKKLEKDPKYKNLSFKNFSVEDRLRDSIVDKVYEGIVKSQLDIAKRDKKVDLIDVKMTSGNEYFSKRFVELLTLNAIRYFTDYKIKKSKQNVEVLQHQTDSVKQTLFGNITQVAELNDVNVNPLRQITRTSTQRKQIDVQANSLLYGELLKNLELAKLALRKETPLIQIVDPPSLPLKKEKLGRLLAGIAFGFITGILVIFYLLTKRWLSINKISS